MEHRNQPYKLAQENPFCIFYLFSKNFFLNNHFIYIGGKKIIRSNNSRASFRPMHDVGGGLRQFFKTFPSSVGKYVLRDISSMRAPILVNYGDFECSPPKIIPGPNIEKKV